MKKFRYQKLIYLRTKNPVMVYGDYKDLSEGEAFLYVYTRAYEGTIWLIILNHSDNETVMKLSVPEGEKQLILANYPYATELTESAVLRPHEARIYEIIQ